MAIIGETNVWMVNLTVRTAVLRFVRPLVILYTRVVVLSIDMAGIGSVRLSRRQQTVYERLVVITLVGRTVDLKYRP